MKVCMVSHDYLPNIGGLASHVYYLSSALQRLGHDVFVVNPIAGHRNGVEKVKDANIPTFRIYFSEPSRKFAHIASRSLSIVRGLSHIFESSGSPDILHQHDHRFSTFSMQWMSRNIPWIWTNHTSLFLHDYDRGPIRRWLIRVSYSGVDGLIAVSEELYKKSIYFWGSNTDIRHIPNGVEVNKFSPDIEKDRKQFGLGEDEFVVLCPRRMVPKNGVIYMVHAARHLVERYPDVKWRFVFLGGEPTGNSDKDRYAQRVKEAASADTLRNHVSLLGDLPLEEMPYVNASADLIVMPSLMEAISLSALEGMATQRPIVATNVGGLPQIVHHEETGLLVPPEDSEALAEAIYRVYSDAALRREIAANAREFVVEEYSWEAVARKTVTFYQDVLDNNEK